MCCWRLSISFKRATLPKLDYPCKVDTPLYTFFSQHLRERNSNWKVEKKKTLVLGDYGCSNLTDITPDITILSAGVSPASNLGSMDTESDLMDSWLDSAGFVPILLISESKITPHPLCQLYGQLHLNIHAILNWTLWC